MKKRKQAEGGYVDSETNRYKRKKSKKEIEEEEEAARLVKKKPPAKKPPTVVPSPDRRGRSAGMPAKPQEFQNLKKKTIRKGKKEQTTQLEAIGEEEEQEGDDVEGKDEEEDDGKEGLGVEDGGVEHVVAGADDEEQDV